MHEPMQKRWTWQATNALNCRISARRGLVRWCFSLQGVIHHGEQSVECAVLIPDLTRHVDVVEVISTAFLREHLQLSDGDHITISL